MVYKKLITKNISSVLFPLFIIAILLFKIPNFYYLPVSASGYFTSQAVARVFIFLVFILNVLFYMENHKTNLLKQKSIVLTILLLFAIQSSSILVVKNLLDFLIIYKDIVLGILAFFTFYFYRHKTSTIIKVFLLTIPINFFYQISLYFFQESIINFFREIIYQKHFEFVTANLARGRILADLYDESSVPFLKSDSPKNSKKNNFIRIALFSMITTTSLISNFRTRIITLIISSIGTFIIFKKYFSKKVLFILLILFLLTGILVSRASQYITGYSFVDRLLLENEIDDVKSAYSRLNQISTSVVFGLSSPLGVGLGNYYDTLPTGEKQFANNNIVGQTAIQYVHNIFGSILAESGLFALITFIILLLLFIKNDILKLKKGTKNEKMVIVAFWSLFSFSLFNPQVPGSYQFLFWGLRGLLL